MDNAKHVLLLCPTVSVAHQQLPVIIVDLDVSSMWTNVAAAHPFVPNAVLLILAQSAILPHSGTQLTADVHLAQATA